MFKIGDKVIRIKKECKYGVYSRIEMYQVYSSEKSYKMI